jgi:hypothetical protein
MNSDTRLLRETESNRRVALCEVDSPYLREPAWPWLAVGWVIVGLFALLFWLSWIFR